MSITTTKLVVIILISIWLLTLGRSLLIMLCGKNIFKKASKGEKTAYYPIVNLFTMLEVADISTYFGIILFIPIINVFILAFMSIKLGKVFKCSTGYIIGLVLLPFLFYPLLSISDKQYKIADEAYFKAMNNARSESINLMTEEEISALNSTPVEEENKVDSIFKSEIELKATEAPGSYRATKIDLLGMEKLKEASNDEQLLKPSVKVEDISDTPAVKKDDNDIEMMDL